MSKKITKYLLILSLIFTLQGCTSLTSPPPIVQNFDYNDILNYNFADLTDSCTLHTNISIYNNTSCGINEREAFVFYDNLTNWNMLCCDFSTQCFEQNYTNVSDICTVNNNTAYTGYTYKSNNKWIGFCCDFNGANCYVDSDIIIEDPTTLCDLEYTLSTFSLDYNHTNSSLWDAVCCKGGVE